jgi:hypothetical protein
LNLDTVLGNKNGRFAWAGSGFIGSSRSSLFESSGSVFSAELKEGWQYTRDNIKLTDYVRVAEDGTLAEPQLRTIDGMEIMVTRVSSVYPSC